MRDAAFSWLAAWGSATQVVFGALLLVLIGSVTRASWNELVRRPVASLAATIPVLAVLFLPVVVCLRVIYPWTAGDPRAPWLSEPFFLVRSGLVLGSWSVLALLAWKAAVHDETWPVLGAAGLPWVILSGTLAAFDWFMSLEPRWSSAIYGVVWLAAAFKAGVAAAVLVSPRESRHVLGRLLLTAVAFWAYVAFMQGLIIWIANIPREVAWYMPRLSGGWQHVLAFIVVGGVAVPFFALLPRRWKESRALAVLVLVTHHVDALWQVLPASGRAATLGLADALSLSVIAGLSCLTMRQLRARAREPRSVLA